MKTLIGTPDPAPEPWGVTLTGNTTTVGASYGVTLTGCATAYVIGTSGVNSGWMWEA